MAKQPGALLTIGELSSQLGVAQHILRYWESKFPQLKPMQRAGNRRYYRPDDVVLAIRINRLLNEEGYTVKGAQKALKDGAAPVPIKEAAPLGSPPASPDLSALKALRDRLARALDA